MVARVAARRLTAHCCAPILWQGDIAPGAAADVAGALYDMGCYEVSMGDTTGAGTPASVTGMLEATARAVPVQHVAAHLHDTYGQVRLHSSVRVSCIPPLPYVPRQHFAGTAT